MCSNKPVKGTTGEKACFFLKTAVQFLRVKKELPWKKEALNVADIHQFKEQLSNTVAKAGESLKGLDAGVAYTKVEDLIHKMDLDGKKQQITDFLDSPKMDEIKSSGRTVRDFLGFIPSYAQSIPGMIKDGLDKLKKK